MDDDEREELLAEEADRDLDERADDARDRARLDAERAERIADARGGWQRAFAFWRD